MYDEIKYYIENRSDNTKYYEFQRDGNKEIERFLIKVEILSMKILRRNDNYEIL